jgi:tetratricopeptide (TPR) repeat protein
VQSRGVVMRFRGKEVDPREVGRELGVQVVIEGAVRRAPGSFRIDARVVSVADGFQLWARRFTGGEGDPLRLNDEVARAVASALTAEVPGPSRGEGDAEAVDLYLRARAMQRRFYSGDASEAVAVFEKALARSPTDPRVIAGWVMSKSMRPWAVADEFVSLRSEAERAVSLAPSLADAHVALGTVLFHFGREDEAVAPLLRALRITRSCAEAHDVLGRLLVEVDHAKAPEHLEAALALEPELEFTNAALSRYHALKGNWDAAFSLTEGQVVGARSRFLMWKRDAEGARAALATIPPDADLTRPIWRGMSAMLRATAYGEPPPATLMPVPNAKPRVRAFMAQLGTEIAATLGDTDRAFATLDECRSLGVVDVAWIERCPALDSVRGDPRFEEIRASIRARARRVLDAYTAFA